MAASPSTTAPGPEPSVRAPEPVAERHPQPARAKQRRTRNRAGKRPQVALLILAVPAVAFFVVFAYLPMAGLVVAFKDFDVNLGIFGSPWSGLANFRYFFSSGDAPRILVNTLFLNVLFLGATLLAGITLAVMLNEVRHKLFKRTVQSVIFFPYFVSPIVISIILQVLLAGVGGSGGAANDLLKVFSLPEVSWYTEPGPWPWILTIVKVWQLGGYLSIIFLAAITSIPEEVYEAGMMDGASRAQMALRITVPLLRPTAAVLLVLGIGRIFYGDFGTIYAIVGDNGTLFPTTDVIDTYVFRSLRQLGDFGTTAAIGLFQSVVGFVLVVAAVLVQRRYAKETSVL
ncbi:putative aldouronate transport system permease protein [Kribbella antiqua]|uniref:Putative aldouronate transport system permease protein n=1 Tax=Kribbella antiqua TaxID=2512217 RepID=A0A4R2IX69_9ACTN|nr:ABC transporter permease subunit [Kribbella antiqua]TCO49947.1 putative aldouronate transport system permease protein [Kribbella antiqua]